MGNVRDADRLFGGITYNSFTTMEIRDAMKTKVDIVLAKIEARRGRLSKIMVEYEISSERVADLVLQYMRDQENRRNVASYSNSLVTGGAGGGAGLPTQAEEKLVPAGVVANLVTEKELIESESREVTKMRRVLANLRAERPTVHKETGALTQQAVVHTLSDDEIDYLGMRVAAPT